MAGITSAHVFGAEAVGRAIALHPSSSRVKPEALLAGTIVAPRRNGCSSRADADGRSAGCSCSMDDTKSKASSLTAPRTSSRWRRWSGDDGAGGRHLGKES
eukprot:TRINITY_DN10776_c0_g1_i2.p4 TRINITY_DN10776_c0_g1~~TRINITY_DN10776_c0_g1_i2.p4  ORF type:complete len:101 (-),score=8.60 TRINITY_DN10776_c0_g1_i2:119-421(-)